MLPIALKCSSSLAICELNSTPAQSAQPDESQPADAQGAGHRRCDDGEAGNEFCDDQRVDAPAFEANLRLTDARIGFQGNFAQGLENPDALLLTDQVPPAVGQQAGKHRPGE